MMYGVLRYLRQRVPDSGERGSVSLWLVIFTIAAFVLLAFVVDGGQYMNARERAADIAEQAARAGIDQLTASAIRSGQLTLTNAQACPAAGTLVTTYGKGSLSGSDQAGLSMPFCNVTYQGAATNRVPVVTVKVDIKVTPVIPVIFGTFTTGAKETATITCGTAVAEGVC
jgi:Flp pilus assembly protein TadG